MESSIAQAISNIFLQCALFYCFYSFGRMRGFMHGQEKSDAFWRERMEELKDETFTMLDKLKGDTVEMLRTNKAAQEALEEIQKAN